VRAVAAKNLSTTPRTAALRLRIQEPLLLLLAVCRRNRSTPGIDPMLTVTNVRFGHSTKLSEATALFDFATWLLSGASCYRKMPK
jgi:hypothetical protein